MTNDSGVYQVVKMSWARDVLRIVGPVNLVKVVSGDFELLAKVLYYLLVLFAQ